MRQSLKVLMCIATISASNPASAGGDYVSGSITSFQGGESEFTFVFATNSRERRLEESCDEIEVLVEYERVPWYSWLPFGDFGHPTKQQTIDAGKYLEAAHRAGAAVRFGYIGYGLVSTSKRCSFRSRGLAIEEDRGNRVVFSYHDQT